MQNHCFSPHFLVKDLGNGDDNKKTQLNAVPIALFFIYYFWRPNSHF